MEPTQMKKRPLDLLSWGFFLAASICLGISVPATYNVAALTHKDGLGAGLVVLVMELLAFAAKAGTRWFPSWAKTLDRIAIGLLAAAILPNFGEGWGALMTAAASPFWAAVRDYSVWGLRPGAILLVFVWASLPPVGVYFFLAFFVKRQQELELIDTPEAVVERRLKPVIVELEVMKSLDARLLTIVEERQKQLAAVGLLPAPQEVYPRPMTATQVLTKVLKPTPAAKEQLAALGIDVEAELERPQVEGASIEGDEVEAKAEVFTASELTPDIHLDALLAQAGLTRAEARAKLDGYGIKTAEAAYTGLRMLGKLPRLLSFEAFAPLYEVLVAPEAGARPAAKECAYCERSLSNSEYGVAVKYSRRHNQPVLCTSCRKG